ncbi:TetR/AcrR family transcriptional regulator [Phytoactinopolyspora endophytica]|uniref:TetR/AcrR family transcriptional regulator n=1 Tax=Phytoactinopolyspora endophytica TaxID=1642495 RepID=UPI00101DF854|nr:TetR/AcrR family transcriptional regulator [Phytoactinopolyspora endophytica]
MPSSRTSYHHGALREELLQACLNLIETEGVGAVSLRRVAREAGVSPGAPYHHFADRATLLSALSSRGYDLIAERMTAARAAAGDPVRALAAIAEEYVAFARREPGYFWVMFRPELSASKKHPDARQAGDAAFRLLIDTVDDCVRAGVVTESDADAVVLAVWGLGHGLASLWLDGHIEGVSDKLSGPPEEAMSQISRLVESVIAR